MHDEYFLRYTESIANEVICSFSSKLGANLFTMAIVQSFYENLGVNLKQIATQTLLAASGAEKCAL